MRDRHGQTGSVLILGMLVVSMVFIYTVLLSKGSLNFFTSTHYTIQSQQALHLAEAGIDKAIASLNRTAGSYTGEDDVQLGDGSYSVVVTTQGNNKLISATGYIPNKASAQAKKTVQLTVSKGNGVAFNYGVQVGNGGFEMQNNNIVTGSVYSNGNVSINNGSRINGDLIVAGGVQPTSDQKYSCVGANCLDYQFGATISGANRKDVAQSFRPSTSAVLSKVTVRLKKAGAPSDIQVRILADATGKPNKDQVLASGTLPASQVTTSYSSLDITFSTQPQLTAGTTYWLLLSAAALNSSNNWSWQEDTTQPSPSGNGAYSANWQANNPVWSNLTGDFVMETYMGGVVTSASGSNGGTVTGDVRAHSILNMTIGKGAYYQLLQNSTAANYFPNSTDPPPTVLPISDGQLASWKDTAAQAAVYSGDISGCRSTLPSGKYIGSVTFTNSCVVKATSPIWITGDFNLNNGNTVSLDNTFGTASGVIIVDGKVNLSNNNKVLGTNQGSSELMVISTYDSQTLGGDAIVLNNGGNNVVLYAGKGSVNVGNGNTLQQLTAWKVIMQNNAVLNYNSGFSSLFFNSGPSGKYSLVKGTYQLK